MKTFQLPTIALVVATLAVACAFVGHASSHEGIVRVGVLLPLSGPLGQVGVTHRRGHEFAAAEINRSGGIRSLGGARIVLLYGDTGGDPVRGIRETQRLVKSGVAALMGGYQSAVVLPTSSIAEELHIPYIVTTALSKRITERGYRYVFRPEATIEDFVRDEFSFVRYLQSRGHGPKSVALLYEDSLFGQFTAVLQRTYLRDMGLSLVADVSYPRDASDLSSYVVNALSYTPDLLLQTSYLLDSIQIARIIAAKEIMPKGIIATGAGPKDPEFIRTLGNKVSNYWFVINEWSPDMMKDGVRELNARFRERYGVDMDGISAMCYVSTWILKDALERAGSTDGEELREALANTDIDGDIAGVLPLGMVRFDKNGQNKTANLITQIQDGRHHTVWPPEIAAKKPLWPIPGSNKR